MLWIRTWCHQRARRWWWSSIVGVVSAPRTGATIYSSPSAASISGTRIFGAWGGRAGLGSRESQSCGMQWLLMLIVSGQPANCGYRCECSWLPVLRCSLFLQAHVQGMSGSSGTLSRIFMNYGFLLRPASPSSPARMLCVSLPNAIFSQPQQARTSCSWLVPVLSSCIIIGSEF